MHEFFIVSPSCYLCFKKLCLVDYNMTRPKIPQPFFGSILLFKITLNQIGYDETKNIDKTYLFLLQIYDTGNNSFHVDINCAFTLLLSFILGDITQGYSLQILPLILCFYIDFWYPPSECNHSPVIFSNSMFLWIQVLKSLLVACIKIPNVELLFNS